MKQYDLYIVNLDPTVGSEIRKTRPCIIISPDEMNRDLRTVQIAPLTSTLRQYPWRVPVRFQGRDGMVAPDQIRTVDRVRLVKKVGHASPNTVQGIKSVIQEMLIE